MNVDTLVDKPTLAKTGLLVGSWFLLEPWGPGLGFFFHKEEGLLALSLINIFKVKLVGFGSGSSFLDQWFDMSMCKL